MRKSIKFVFIIVFVIVSFSLNYTYANQIPTGQDVGSTERGIEQAKEKKSITQELIKPKKPSAVQEKDEITPKIDQETITSKEIVLINKIEIRGVTLFDESFIRSIVSQYEGQKLSLSEFRDIADSITAEYRQRGYVTSMAYLPPQKIDSGNLIIEVLEGKVGNIQLKGNQYFSDKIILKYVTLEKGELFNYDKLRLNINRLNQHPDRDARVTLLRGEQFGQTDIDIQVEDRFPMHVTLGYNNYNSRYLDRNKYSAEFMCTSFFGLDDIAAVEIQSGDDIDTFKLFSARYLAELLPGLKMGIIYNRVEQKLGREVSNLDIQGKGDVVSVFYSYNFLNNDDLIVTFNAGFDYKDIENRVLGIVLSEDNVRIAKLGVDLNFDDSFGGRNIITQEFDYGIKDFMGGLDKKDPQASRQGAGGNFFRTVTNAARIQTLPLSMALMLKGSMQFTPYNLVSAEQFQVGGAATVRGYPRAEYVGDKGYNAIAELYIPAYGISKNVKIPYTNTNLFDALRLVTFFDWGLVETKTPQVGENKREDIYSAGAGIRFNIEDKLSVSFDYGFALGQDTSDGSNGAGYVEVKCFF